MSVRPSGENSAVPRAATGSVVTVVTSPPVAGITPNSTLVGRVLAIPARPVTGEPRCFPAIRDTGQGTTGAGLEVIGVQQAVLVIRDDPVAGDSERRRETLL
jgi:hypothetical protein